MRMDACPKCQGYQSYERDGDGEYIFCISCGHVSYPAEIPKGRAKRIPEPQVEERGVKEVLAREEEEMDRLVELNRQSIKNLWN